MRIRVFYHLFLVNEWRHVFGYHLARMRESGLHDACSEIQVGAVYEDELAVAELDSLLRGDGKMSLRFVRALNDPRPSGATPRSDWPTAGSGSPRPCSP